MCHARCVESDQACGQFVVRSSFTLTNRGTCILGFIAEGNLRAGDQIRWTDIGGQRRTRCKAVNEVREAPIQDPPTIGLIVEEGDPSEFSTGMQLLAYRS